MKHHSEAPFFIWIGLMALAYIWPMGVLIVILIFGLCVIFEKS